MHTTDIAWIAGLSLGLAAAIALAYLPGRIARRRGHASHEAIHVCGLVGLLIWPAWWVALIWAYSGPASDPIGRAAPAAQHCAHCGRVIGRLETPRVWQGSVVCVGCRDRLRAAQA